MRANTYLSGLSAVRHAGMVGYGAAATVRRPQCDGLSGDCALPLFAGFRGDCVSTLASRMLPLLMPSRLTSFPDLRSKFPDGGTQKRSPGKARRDFATLSIPDPARHAVVPKGEGGHVTP